MIDAIREGREPLISGREGWRAVELVSAIYESGRTNRPVTPPLQAGSGFPCTLVEGRTCEMR